MISDIFVPNAPQRIATDTSQKVPIRFGTDLVAAGLGGKIDGMLGEMLTGSGAVRAILKKYLPDWQTTAEKRGGASLF